MEQVNVISLIQPWASLVVMGAKKWETRSRATKFRGLIYIHSSAQFPDEYKAMTMKTPFSLYIPDYSQLQLGRIIGHVEIVDCIPTEKWLSMHQQTNADHYREWQFGNYNFGRYAWELKNPVMFTLPVRAKGSLGIWKFDKSKLLAHE